MHYGFVKVCSATVPVKVADVEYNTENIIKAIKESTENGSMLTVFPELCVCGYTCGDLFNQRLLIEKSEEGLNKIVRSTAGTNNLIFVGVPVIYGGKLYNCAVAVSGAKILGVIPKTYLPDYGEFYERRNFAVADGENSELLLCGQSVPFGTKLVFSAKNFKDFTVSAEICEDLWAPLSPSVGHSVAGANIIVNLSCSDEIAGKCNYRRDLVRMQSAKLICGYIYTDAGDGESTTDMAFAGHNIISENGTVLAESKLFDNGLIYSEIDVEMLADEKRRTASGFFSEIGKKGYSVIEFTAGEFDGKLSREFPKFPFVPDKGEKLSERVEIILSIQAKGLEKRLIHTGAKTAVIGISGGLDSALALLVAYRAFGYMGKDAKDIIAVTMPGFGTTDKTKNNSVKLIEALGATCKIVPIADSVNLHFNDIGHDKDKYDVTYENAQARMRTLILMDIANQTGGLVIGTGDLSELALGWATYNGDHMSMYGVNSSVPKTLVKHLIAYEAERLKDVCGDILKDILDTEISPELLPPENGKISQKTEDIVGPYILHDFFLYYAVRKGFKPEKILWLAKKTFKDYYDGKTVEKWLKNFYKRFFAQQFKRSCVPDGVKVGSVALSPRGDWRMPSDAVSDLWINNID